MLLMLQKYGIRVKYTPGKELYVADTLSRAYLPNESVSASVATISEESSAENLAIYECYSVEETTHGIEK